MRGFVKNLRYILPLLCILLSSWASAQTQSAQPATNDSDTTQQSELENSPSEEKERKHYEELSKKSLSRLTSELRDLENQWQEKEDAFRKLSSIQENLQDRLQERMAILVSQLEKAEGAWRTFDRRTETLVEGSSKEDLEEAKKALEEFRNIYFEELSYVPRNIFSAEESRTMRAHGVPVNFGVPREWTSISFSSLRGPNNQDTSKAAHDRLKNIRTTNKEIPKLFTDVRAQAEKQNKDLQERLAKKVSERLSELTKLRAERDTLAQVVDDKSGADHKLTFAIYFMVAALIILYVATLFARESIQSTIFENRTLVEMIGMAFLLLTIIILGTGEKMDRSVLGALLGTVGGYIFGQQNRSSDRPKRRKQANPDGPPRKKKKATELMTENVQRAAQEGTTTPPATKAPEMPSGMASSTPVTRAEITPPEALKILPEQKPAAGS